MKAPLDFMQPRLLLEDLMSRFPGVVMVETWGETSLFYNANNILPRGVYFATIKEKDGKNDRGSHLNRDGVFRLNIGATKHAFVERFGSTPSRPGQGEIIQGPWDFTALDTITPHPVYGWMSWMSVLNPSSATLTQMESIIDDAYEKSKFAFAKRTGQPG